MRYTSLVQIAVDHCRPHPVEAVLINKIMVFMVYCELVFATTRSGLDILICFLALVTVVLAWERGREGGRGGSVGKFAFLIKLFFF